MAGFEPGTRGRGSARAPVVLHAPYRMLAGENISLMSAFGGDCRDMFGLSYGSSPGAQRTRADDWIRPMCPLGPGSGRAGRSWPLPRGCALPVTAGAVLSFLPAAGREDGLSGTDGVTVLFMFPSGEVEPMSSFGAA